MKISQWCGLLAVGTLMALWPAIAQAQPVSDSLIITVTGQPPVTIGLDESTETSTHTVTVPTFAPTGGTITVNLLDPSTLPPAISDRITVTVDIPETGSQQQTVHIDFTSDAENPLTGTTSPQDIAETGGLQTLSLSGLPGTPSFTLQVQSDADVPEPGTVALVGTGLLGLVGWRRRPAAR